MPNTLNFADGDKRRQAGFSFIELMISMVVFLIFISAVYGLLRIANIQKATVNSETEVMTNLRVSLNTVGRDAVNAGLRYSRVGGNMPDNLTNVRMGLPADADGAHDFLTAVIAGNDVNANNLLPAAEKTDVVAFAYRDMSFNDGNPVKITNAANLSTDGVLLTTEDTANIRPFDLFLFSDGTRTAVGLATSRPNNTTMWLETSSAADVLRINAPYGGAPDARSKLINCAALPSGTTAPTDCMNYPTPATVTAVKIYWVSYHVTPEGVLMRTTYGNNTDRTAAEQIQTQPLAYNIRNFQVRYLLRDGTSSENPSNNGANQNVLNNVVQVEVTVSSTINVQENGVNLQRVVDLKSSFSTKNLNYD